MRHKYKLIISVFVLALVANFALAHDEPTTTTTGTTTQQTAKTKLREAKTKAITAVGQNQVRRAQKAFDKLSAILDRMKTKRAALTGTSTDITQLDALIAKAETQKTDAQTALNDVKTKLAAMTTALTTATTSTTAVAPKQQVKDFMASVKVLKTKLIAFHKTLQQMVPILSTEVKAQKVEDESSDDAQKVENENETQKVENKSSDDNTTNTTNTNTSGTNAAEQEND